MPSVGIIGNNGREVAKAFLRMSKGVSCYHITEKHRLGPKVNILVAAGVSPVLKSMIPSLTEEDYLVVNSDDKEIFPHLTGNTAQLITYGFNTRACITASSVMDGGLQVCIQRAFYGIDGTEKLPQEFSAKIAESEETESVLGAAAAWAIAK